MAEYRHKIELYDPENAESYVRFCDPTYFRGTEESLGDIINAQELPALFRIHKLPRGATVDWKLVDLYGGNRIFDIKSIAPGTEINESLVHATSDGSPDYAPVLWADTNVAWEADGVTWVEGNG